MATKSQMQYQVLRRLKTKTKLEKLCDTLKEAHEYIKSQDVPFMELSYIGQFPTYASSVNGKIYQIQGLHKQLGIVLGFDKEAKLFNFNN